MDHRKENSENIKLEALFQYFATLCKSSHKAFKHKPNAYVRRPIQPRSSASYVKPKGSHSLKFSLFGDGWGRKAAAHLLTDWKGEGRDRNDGNNGETNSHLKRHYLVNLNDKHIDASKVNPVLSLCWWMVTWLRLGPHYLCHSICLCQEHTKWAYSGASSLLSEANRSLVLLIKG